MWTSDSLVFTAASLPTSWFCSVQFLPPLTKVAATFIALSCTKTRNKKGTCFFFPGERNVVLYFVSPSEVWVLNRAFLPLNQFSRNFLSFFGEGFALPVQCVGGIGVTWHSNQSLHWIWRIFRQISLPLIQWELFFSFLIRRNPPPRHYPVNFVEGTPHLSL